MIIVLKPEASEREVDHIIDRLRELGLKSHTIDRSGADDHRGDRRRSDSAQPAAHRLAGRRERVADSGSLETWSAGSSKKRTPSSM